MFYFSSCSVILYIFSSKCYWFVLQRHMNWSIFRLKSKFAAIVYSIVYKSVFFFLFLLVSCFSPFIRPAKNISPTNHAKNKSLIDFTWTFFENRPNTCCLLCPNCPQLRHQQQLQQIINCLRPPIPTKLKLNETVFLTKPGTVTAPPLGEQISNIS